MKKVTELVRRSSSNIAMFTSRFAETQTEILVASVSNQTVELDLFQTSVSIHEERPDLIDGAALVDDVAATVLSSVRRPSTTGTWTIDRKELTSVVQYMKTYMVSVPEI